MTKISLLKALIAAGFGSRRKMASAIKEGRVKVNGDTASAFSHTIDINQDRVQFDGVEVGLQAKPKVYLALNKPAGVLSTTSDDRGRKTVLDFIPPYLRSIKMFPVGRLDKDSTGLVLLTNDGDAAFRLSHPRFEHEKEYLVDLDRILDDPYLAQLRKGVELNDGCTRPAKVVAMQDSNNFTYSVIIHEGKNHIVRRMFARLGYIVVKLKRIRIACVNLGDLSLGQTRLLEQEEVRRLQEL
ncbi:MAG: pseudouridine synthase [Dehalococcoidales bacterium]